MQPKSKLQLVTFFFTDLISAALSVLCALTLTVSLRYQYIPTVPFDFVFLVIAVFAAFLISFFTTGSERDIGEYSSLRMLANRIAAGIVFLACISMLIIAEKSIWRSYRLFLGTSSVLFVLFSYTLRMIVKSILIHTYKHSRAATLTGVITISERAEDIVAALSEQWTRRVVGVALVDRNDISSEYRNVYPDKQMSTDDDPPPHEIAGIPVKADFGSFIDWVRKDSLDEVFVDLPYDSGMSLIPFLVTMESMGVVVHVNVPLCDAITDNPNLTLRKTLITVNGKPMLTCSAAEQNPIHLFIKRCIDLCIGLVGTILSAPIILLVAIPLLIESPGPLIFKQKRVGKNGRIFNIYKLRSMYRDAEERKKALMEQNEMQGLMFKMKNDPRITKVGRFIRRTSIDELPQFWNILRGDMSFVGTRPPTVNEYNEYHSHHKRRLSMKPGLTGLWQVSGRSNITDFEEVVKLDCQYIDNWSLRLDLKIMFKTVGVVFRNHGAE